MKLKNIKHKQKKDLQAIKIMTRLLLATFLICSCSSREKRISICPSAVSYSYSPKWITPNPNVFHIGLDLNKLNNIDSIYFKSLINHNGKKYLDRLSIVFNDTIKKELYTYNDDRHSDDDLNIYVNNLSESSMSLKEMDDLFSSYQRIKLLYSEEGNKTIEINLSCPSTFSKSFYLNGDIVLKSDSSRLNYKSNNKLQSW